MLAAFLFARRARVFVCKFGVECQHSALAMAYTHTRERTFLTAVPTPQISTRESTDKGEHIYILLLADKK